MDGAIASWVPASVVAGVSLVSFAWQRVQNGKAQSKLAGRFEQKVEGLSQDMRQLSKSVEDHLRGDCPVGRRLDRLEDRIDHLKETPK